MAGYLYWEPFWVIWGVIFRYVTLFLDSHSMFSHKNLYRRFLYYSDGHYTKRIIHRMFPSTGGHFQAFP